MSRSVARPVAASAPTPLRFGIVGCGRFGPRHARACLDSTSVRLIGVHDIEGGRADAVALSHECGAFSDLASLRRTVDAVCVVVPPDAHADIVESCLADGIHVLVEKPFGTDPARAVALLDLARRRRRVLMAGYVERFHPTLEAAIARAGTCERLVVRRLSRPIPGLHPVDVVHDLMSHGIEYALRLFGAAPLSGIAVARASTDDRVETTLTFSGGRSARILVHRTAMAPERTVAIGTGDGTVVADLLTGMVDDRGRSVAVPVGNPLATQLEHFVRRIRLGDATDDDLAARVLAVASEIIDRRDHRRRRVAA